MRPLLLAFCCFAFVSISLKAQNSPDCRTAIPVCADGPIEGIAHGSGDVDDFDPDVIAQTGCLEKGSNIDANIEHNTSWFVFRAGTAGQVGFNIEALPVSGSTITAEWDFAVYGPYTEAACVDIGNGAEQPIRCNYEVNATRYTGLGVNPENGQVGEPSLTQNLNTYDEYLDVQPGEIYYIFINNYNTNFDDDPERFRLTFTGSSVDADSNTALDCTFRDEFLGLDITACDTDPAITLSALNTVVGNDIANVVWSVDYDDDGTIDATLTGSGPYGAEYVVSGPNSGRYFAVVTPNVGPTVTDSGGILITFHGIPVLDRIEQLETNLSVDPDLNTVEIFVNGNSSYEYAINGGPFQDDPVFRDIPPGLNSLIINDKNRCGTTDPIDFLVLGYPKFFTPNGDGIHDYWHILGMERPPALIDPVVYIFDRYGKLLAQLDANSIGWDGTFNGRPMPSSDYWFRFEYQQDESGTIVAKTRKTHFALKR